MDQFRAVPQVHVRGTFPLIRPVGTNQPQITPPTRPDPRPTPQPTYPLPRPVNPPAPPQRPSK